MLGMFERLRQSVLPTNDQPYTPATIRSSHPRTIGQKLLALLPALAMGLAGIVLVVAVGLFVFRAMYDGRIYPAVIVGDVPVGGLTVAAAEAELQARATALETGTVTFSHGGQTWTPTLAELGVTVDLAGSLAQAEALGRSGDAATRLGTARELLQHDQVVPLRTALDAAVLGAWFDRVDADLGQPAVNARVVVEGTTVTVAPDAPGLAVDRAAATAAITEALRTLEPVSMDLPARAIAPDIVAGDLTGAQAEIDTLLDTSIRITFEDQTWHVSAESLIPYLTVETTLADGEPVTRVNFDRVALAAELRRQFAGEINQKPVEAVIRWDQAVGLVAIEPSRDGLTVNGGAFAKAVAEGILTDAGTVAIPVVVVKPDVDSGNLAALGITELLGSGESNFSYGVPGRDENVRVAAQYLDGTLVRPGEDFSFNTAIGEITPERGFQEALVVQGEGVGRDYGGGVCQVSTTVFRAALWAGMPITEWYQHTFRLPNYEYDGWSPGFDASILQAGSDPDGWADFRFQNYTDHWLLVEATVSYPHVSVNIYGTGDGRTVDFTTYQLGDTAFGFDRVIRDASGKVIADRAFVSYFQ